MDSDRDRYMVGEIGLIDITDMIRYEMSALSMSGSNTVADERA